MGQPTHYDVLGLPPSADQVEVRKRFRELARRYHPDVATAADAAARFREINEAHQVLSDPARRAAYDAELKLARIRAERAERTSRPATPHMKPAAPARAAGAGPSARSPRPAPRPSEAARPAAPSHQPSAAAAAVVTEAQRAFGRMRFRDAEILCRQALRLDRRSAAACELLGDICLARGRTEEANKYYSYAVQFDPRNARVQAKIDRLMRGALRETAPVGYPDAGRSAAAARLLLNGVGLGGLGFLLVEAIHVVQTSPAATAVWVEWDPLALLALAAMGFVLGFLMSINRMLAYARDELFPAAARPHGRIGLPVGLLLFAFSCISFYAAFVVYTLVGFAQETVSRSVVRAFAACFTLTALFALFSPSSSTSLLISGGNVIFAALLLGWPLGDLFRK